jgi:hypothetical protein
MINTTGLLMNAWYQLLNNAGLSVYKEDVPENVEGNYVLLRAEGGTSMNNKRSFADETVIVVDIVTQFQSAIDRSEVETIDNTINGLILPTMQNGLTAQSGMQILNVNRETFTYLTETDNEKKYYRKVSRYVHTIYQTA